MWNNVSHIVHESRLLSNNYVSIQLTNSTKHNTYFYVLFFKLNIQTIRGMVKTDEGN